MKTKIKSLLAVFVTLTDVQVSHADELSSYVKQCQKELQFENVSIPHLNCFDGEVFDDAAGPFGSTKDVFGYEKITDAVDLTFACRWISRVVGANNSLLGGTAAGVEMLLHNRKSGNTCFFSSKLGSIQFGNTTFKDVASTEVVSPTSSNASTYWLQPTQLNKEIQCIGCHVAGPYIASAFIAPLLAKHGLLNNGHTTMKTKVAAKGKPEYHAVGTGLANNPFANWDSLVRGTKNADGTYKDNGYLLEASSTCADQCHGIGYHSPAETRRDFPVTGNELQRSITQIIEDVQAMGVMPPNSHGHYAWINRDTPTIKNGNEFAGSGDYEWLSDVKKEYPGFHCDNPSALEAHVVGSDSIVSTAYMNTLGDKLKIFNLREGLVCVDADQPDGRCEDYLVRYQCGDGEMTEWYDKDNPGPTQDNESRSNIANLCKGRGEPISIQTTFWLKHQPGMTSTTYVDGPHDRLSQFNTNGLVCKNADQPNGASCSNYVVRFRCD
jgi:hypothetical protein